MIHFSPFQADKFDEDAEREKQRMIEYLIGKGLGEDAAKRVIDTVAVEEHKDFFVEFVMNEDRGLEVCFVPPFICQS